MYPAQFKRRTKGHRRAPLMFPQMFSLAELPAGYTAQVVGQFMGRSGYGELVPYNEIVVTCPCGTRVAAYSRVSPDNGYVVCQHYMYHVVKP